MRLGSWVGLYQIADQLAIQLVLAVRERMLRIRFLTAMAVGSLVIEDLEGDPRHRDATPYLVWEWLVVEALTREVSADPSNWGVPGTAVTRTARAQHGYLDARSYLKTPRVFGFHGVYKRLAVHGETAFMVPMFDAFMKRQMPDLVRHVPQRRSTQRPGGAP